MGEANLEVVGIGTSGKLFYLALSPQCAHNVRKSYGLNPSVASGTIFEALLDAYRLFVFQVLKANVFQAEKRGKRY